MSEIKLPQPVVSTMPVESAEDLLAQHQSAIGRLYQTAEAAQWGLSLPQFAEALWQSCQRRHSESAPFPFEKFLDSLHVRDLAVAAACRLGLEPAWNAFVTTYRPVLYAAARAIARDEVRGRELADSLYADLYGLEIRAGRRRSLLQYFDGRSSLSTWLHALIAAPLRR